MTAQYHAILGLPRSGKTTFLAALWHLIDAGEVATQLVLEKLVGDHAHLNSIVDAWRKCTEVPRTSMAGETTVSIFARTAAGDKAIVLEFPDLSGESFKEQFRTRSCSPAYVEGYERDGGVLLFVNADRPSDGMSLLDIPADGASEVAGAVLEAEMETPWSADMVPEQVQLVELLQFLISPPFMRRRRRLALVVSAWDTVGGPKPTPDEWLGRELPLLHQFLRSNAAFFETRVYGVSAQGGDVKGDQRADLLKLLPSERIECVGDGVVPHDLTAPLLWLSEDGGRGD